ncbi:malto-oligosyltrehalose trehalohydrolase [Arsenicicoccus sp. oral taxon 190]|uniref:malto-oligosyltrehalose trehalohydrolase n=1 Tax=Arsenicicoccus sp. oral taxon 190 TaxID=1658671 RepID=UPI00067A4296|nr:malto-oligosyltrehalose trehalohydrolase [Arsenicicoccus sp. oral taxon 190]AKT50310.1 malto-oligosyltrehalose trehalohydrolase [Arsenicicoccus sp. oral taxon 190]
MTSFTLWAPGKDRVEVVAEGRRLPLAPGEGGWWRLETDEIAPTARYGFSLDGGDLRPDPRGRRLEDGPHGLTTPYDPSSFAWTDQGWAGRPLEGSVIYELHVGTFTPAGTFDAAIERLDHLVELGVTTIEIMPVATFPGVHNWGYDGVALFAVHEPYGGPAGLQRLVDAAHGRGLAVCLDVVYNHFGPDGNYLAEFGPYFTELHHTPWGAAVNLDGPGSDEVRRYLLDNVTMWLRDFHVDALRLDAVHALIDDRALPILEEMSREVDALAAEVGRPLTLVAEDDRNDARTTTPRGEGAAVAGLGIHGQWTDDIHHALHVALTGETDGYYADFASPEALPKVFQGAFFHDGSYSSFRGRCHGRPVDRATVPGWRFVASLQTHDQVGNRRVGDRLSMGVAPGRLAAGAALLLTSPFTPMLFMGEEWAASTPWQYFTDHQDPTLVEAIRNGRAAEFASHGWGADEVPDPQAAGTVEASRLDWSEPEQGEHARMLEWYRTLLRLRRTVPDLSDPRLSTVRLDWDAERRLAVLHRGAHRVVASLADEPVTVPLQGGQVLACWDEPTTGDDTITLPGPGAVVVGPR